MSRGNITALNYSLNYGLAVWEGLRVYGKSILYLEKHVKRLLAAAEELRTFESLPSEADVKEQILETVEWDVDHADSMFRYIRPIIYVDADERTASAVPLPARLEVYVMPAKSIFEKDYTLAEGINVAYFDNYEGFSKERLVCHSKFLKMPGNYVQADRMRLEANRKLAGAAQINEVLFFDRQNSTIVEGGFSNIFGARKNGKQTLVTPKALPSFLPGITREWALRENVFSTNELIWGFGELGVPFSDLSEIFMVGTHMEIKSVLNVYRIRRDGFDKVWSVGDGGNFAFADKMRQRYRGTAIHGLHL